MNRYLLNISYIGTGFRGIQRTKTTVNDVPYMKTTVQGALELGLKLLKPVNNFKLALSSRTDSGVHALHSTVHVDLVRQNQKLYHESAVTLVLNRFFFRENIPVRVLSTEHVSSEFHSRYHAKSRSYMYRIATPKEGLCPIELQTLSQCHTKFVPIEELDRCYFIHNTNFNIEKAREAAKLFHGTHDFRTFMGASKQIKEKHAFFALRSILHISIDAAVPICNSSCSSRANDIYNYWNINITGRSFVYRQVRRIVGAILAVAQERLTIRDIYEMLTIPSANSWCSQSNTAPAYGLYLKNVSYNENDKKNFT